MTPDDVARRLAADPAATGLFCDFDGTLTPIVADPETSALDPETAGLLERLATRLALVAVVSGRPATFLLARAAVPGVLLLGLYGLERAVDGNVTPRPELAEWQGAVERAKRLLATELEGHDGIWIEDKGRAVAVHWRRAPDPDAAQLLVAVAVGGAAEATGLAVEPGKMVAELRPPVDWDKGAAVAAVADETGLGELAYLGDDLGDLPALAAVRARGGVAVAVDHGEATPPELRAVADVLLAGPDGVHRWLEDLAARLG